MHRVQETTIEVSVLSAAQHWVSSTNLRGLNRSRRVTFHDLQRDGPAKHTNIVQPLHNFCCHLIYERLGLVIVLEPNTILVPMNRQRPRQTQLRHTR